MSFDELKTLLDQTDKQKVTEYLDKVSTDNLCNIIATKINDPDILKVVQGTLNAFGTSENALKKKRKLIISIFNALRDADLNSKDLNNIVSSIVINLPTFSSSHLKLLVDDCLDRIRNKDDTVMCWTDVLPNLLQLLQDEKLLIHESNSISGQQYKAMVIKSICNYSWEKHILTPLVKMFRDITMEKQDLELVNKTLCNNLMKVELNELPPLVHQMLSLNGDDTKLLLFSLCNYFSEKYSETINDTESYDSEIIDKVNKKDIQIVESTVLYHIYQSTLIKQKSLKELLKFLKNNTTAPEIVLDPFLMSVLLMAYNFYPEILDILKAAVSRQIQGEIKIEHSLWIRNMISKNLSIIKVVSHIIDNSDQKERHYVLQGLIEFAFLLMSSNEKKGKDDNCLPEIGFDILRKLVKKRHASCSIVIELLSHYILQNAEGNFLIFTKCLSFICYTLTIVALEYKTEITQFIYHLSSVPKQCAIQIIKALLPVINLSPNVRDVFILELRKCLYQSGTDSREMAVEGFLCLLQKLKIKSLNVLSQSSSSAVSVSNCVVLTQATLENQNHSTDNAVYNSALARETLNILKRCFTHGSEVRTKLYKKLPELIICNPELSELITTMLVDHFLTYYNPNEDIPLPLELNKCVMPQGVEMIIEEPLGDLIYALQNIYIITASKTTSTGDNLLVILESLCRRMARLELEHMEMDDGVEFFDDIPTALRKLQDLKICLSTCEALMVFRIDSWSRSSIDSAQNIYALLKTYNRLIEFTKKINKPKKDAKKKDKKKDKDDPDATNVGKKEKNSVIAQATKIPPTVMEFKTVNKILQLLYLDSVPWVTKEQSTSLRSRVDFNQYILQTLLHLIQTAKTEKPVNVRKFSNYVDIGEVLYKHVVLNLNNVRLFDYATSILGLECFKELCDFICTCYKKELPKFLEALSDIPHHEGLRAQIQKIILTMLGIVKENLDQKEEEEADDPIPKKEPIILMDTISHLVHKMPYEEDDREVLNYLHNMVQELSNSSITGSIIQLLLFIEEMVDYKSSILNNICRELLVQLNTVNEMTIDYSPTFDIINKSTSQEVYEIVNAVIKNKLNNVDWYFNSLKAEQNSLTIGLKKDIDLDNIKEKERKLCSQLNVIIEMLELLTNTRVPNFFSDSIFKNVQFLFNVLCKLTKYFCSKSIANNPAFQSVGFISILQRAGREVRNNIYNLINYVELNQQIDNSKDNARLRNKVLRETRMIPKVIYEMEQFQKEIILLEKKTGSSLNKYIKRAINRDFKIQNNLLEQGLEQMDTTDFNTQASNYAAAPNETETDSRTEDDEML